MRIEKEEVGEKIILRPIKEEDTPLIVAWRNNKRVRNNFIFQEPFTEKMHLKWMKSKVASGEVEQFIILETINRKPIGSVYLRDIDYNNKTAEYGIFIGDDEEVGKGYGTAAARMLLDIAFEKLGLEQIYLRVYADNKGAIASYEKAGFMRTERIETVLNENGGHRTLVFMEKHN